MLLFRRCFSYFRVFFFLFFSLSFVPQINEPTGFVRPIRRMVADRQGCPLPRCPKEKMPLSNFREGTNYSLVAVTKASKIDFKIKKVKGMQGKVKFSRRPFFVAYPAPTVELRTYSRDLPFSATLRQ